MNYYKLFEQILLLENKEKFIKNNDTLTDEQKDEMIEFYKKHPNLESEGIDWQKDWTYSDFKKIKSKYNKKSALKLSNSEYKQDVDYYYWGEENGLAYYVPLCYEVQRDLFQKNCPLRWCIGSESNCGHWKDYTEDGSIFIIIYSDKDNMCIQLNNDIVTFWDKEDKAYSFKYNETFLDSIRNGTFSFSKNENIINPSQNNSARIESDDKEFGQYLSADIIKKGYESSNLINEIILENNENLVEEMPIDSYFFEELENYIKDSHGEGFYDDSDVYLNFDTLYDEHTLVACVTSEDSYENEGYKQKFFDRLSDILNKRNDLYSDFLRTYSINDIKDLIFDDTYDYFEFILYIHITYDYKIETSIKLAGYNPSNRDDIYEMETYVDFPNFENFERDYEQCISSAKYNIDNIIEHAFVL